MLFFGGGALKIIREKLPVLVDNIFESKVNDDVKWRLAEKLVFNFQIVEAVDQVEGQ